MWEQTFRAESNICWRSGWMRRWRGRGRGSVFCLSSFSHFHTIWGVNALGNRADRGNCQGLPPFYTDTSPFLYLAFLFLSGKVETSQVARKDGIMSRWEVGIAYYCPFRKLRNRWAEREIGSQSEEGRVYSISLTWDYVDLMNNIDTNPFTSPLSLRTCWNTVFL